MCSVCQLIHQLINSTTDTIFRVAWTHHTQKRVFIIDEMSEKCSRYSVGLGELVCQ